MCRSCDIVNDIVKLIYSYQVSVESAKPSETLRQRQIFLTSLANVVAMQASEYFPFLPTVVAIDMCHSSLPKNTKSGEIIIAQLHLAEVKPHTQK